MKRQSELISCAEITLESAGVPRPRWTAEQLLSNRLDCEPVELYVEPPSISPEQAVGFQADVAARVGGVPLQYLQGTASFYGREFWVGPGVFIPRPETEILVEVALDLLSVCPEPGDFSPVVVDVGAGSGAIAVTLGLEIPGLPIFGIEKSWVALSFARRNAGRLGCRVPFLQGDLVSMLLPGSADLIVANLPYLDPTTAAAWPPELAWEPWLALDGGNRGLALIVTLIEGAYSLLRPRGRLLLEIGSEQADAVCSFARLHSFVVERVVGDLAGAERVVVLWKN